MKRIIQILIKNHVFFVFIILLLISFNFLMKHNLIVETRLSKMSLEFSGFIFNKEKNIKDYFLLKKINNQLLQEQKNLIKQIEVLKKNTEANLLKIDSIECPLVITQAKIVQNTWQKKNNFLTVDKGESHQIKAHLAVANNNNLVGMTHTVSKNFTTVISLLNTNWKVSAKIKNSGHYGTLNWNGRDFNIMELRDIPKNAPIKIGDTIVTSGYSNTLPENLHIGVVENYHIEEKTNFLKISVKLFVDFTSIQYVYIMDSDSQEERLLIEKTLLN
jgi:rod shape-determining protein MreC